MPRTKHDLHSHPDFQGGRNHPVERTHRDTEFPELHTARPSRTNLDRAANAQRWTQEEVADKHRAQRDKRRADLEAKDWDELKGSDFEFLDKCGECHGKLRYDPDFHYHWMKARPICCRCIVKGKGLLCLLREQWRKKAS